ncbi:hypothetical protein ACHAWF_002525, partial [Thalassiosira exigua]
MTDSGVAADLASVFDEWKNGHGKNACIIRSSMAVISLISSSLLIWILHKTKDRFSTTYHRILLGMSVSDILFSLGNAGFGAVTPSELSYIVWNARGNQATCDASGFLNTIGFFASLLYSCSVNFYYLFLIRYNKSEAYIRRKVEPWLHAVPASFALVVSVVFVAMEGNNVVIAGLCSSAFSYVPPHCAGIEDGEVVDGFTIPCGRGRDIDALRKITGLVTLVVAPITIAVSLFLIYRSVAKQEEKMARYGAGALRALGTLSRRVLSRKRNTDASGGDDGDEGGRGGRGVSSLVSAVKSRLGCAVSREAANSTNPNQDASSSNSRKVMHRAAMYSFAYFVTWITLIIYGFLNLAGVWSPEAPYPTWQTAYVYAMSFLTPLQGMWTFLIFMQPKVASRRRSSGGSISWFRAFGLALWSAATGGKKQQQTAAATSA